MRFGICGPLDVAERAISSGFDYTEAGALRFSAEEPFDPEPYRRVRTETSNLFFPSSIQLFGASATDFRPYAREALRRAGEIGIQVMVIGSGPSRKAPEASPEAETGFVEIVAEIAEMARPFGIAVAPESLNQSETNVGNDLGQLARALNARGVGYTADSFHVLVEWDRAGGTGSPDQKVWEEQLPFRPTHVHIADLPRNAPQPGDPHVAGFVARLRELGYDGRVSLEANLANTEVETLRQALRQLRAVFQQ